MLRIHFTGNDLARTRISEARPLWETVLSVRVLRARTGGGKLNGWRAHTRSHLRESSRTLLALCPPEGAFPEFLIPDAETQSWEEDVEAVVSTPRGRLVRDFIEVQSGRRLPADAEPLAAGDPVALRALGDALNDYRKVAIAPYWDRIQARVDVERNFLLRSIAEGGVELLLSTLSTETRWDAGVLEVRCAERRDIRLDGHGLVLAPSVFCGRRPVAVAGRKPPVLFFPTRTDFGAALHDHDPARLLPGALSALLGPTRAAALGGAVHGTTTTELARRLGVTLSTASEHAKVLREAGLITTGRMGRQAVHSITPLGAALFHCPGFGPQRRRPRPDL